MGKVIDISGQKFGRLTVIKLNDVINGDSSWICECDCGNVKNVFGYNLKNGTTLSCGCFGNENSRKIMTDNLIGKAYGCLIVIEQRGIDKAKNSKWLIECIHCKKQRIVLGINLKNGNTFSCTCQKRIFNKPQYKDISNKKYGLITVVDYFGSDSDGNALWNTICECGNKLVIAGYDLRRGSVSSCGCLGESYIASELKKYFIDLCNAEKEYKILKNPDTNKYLPYDIYIPCGDDPKINGIYIEVNGEQHYRFVSSWHKNKDNFKYKQNIDKIKRNFARKNGLYIEIDLRKIETVDDAILYIKGIVETL